MISGGLRVVLACSTSPAVASWNLEICRWLPHTTYVCLSALRATPSRDEWPPNGSDILSNSQADRRMGCSRPAITAAGHRLTCGQAVLHPRESLLLNELAVLHGGDLKGVATSE